MPSSGEDYGRSLAHKMLSPLAPSSKTSLSTLIQQYCTPFVCFPSAPFLLNQSGWRVCGWGTDCSNVRGQRHRRREPIEQTCVGHHPLIDPPLMVAEVIHLYKHGPWYGVSHALPRGGASASLASRDQIIHLVPTCQEGIYHISSTSSILLYPSFFVLSFRSLLSFFSLFTPHPFRFCDTVCGFDIKVAEDINPG